MRVGLFYNLKNQKDSTDLILGVLRNHPYVTEVIELQSKQMQVLSSEQELKFKFDNFTLEKNSLDLIIFRGGLGDVRTTALMSKFCKNNGIKVFDNNLSEVGYLINKKFDSINFAMDSLPIPISRFYSDVSQLRETDLQSPIIYKTINTGQGLNVRKANSLEEIEMYIKRTSVEITQLVFQEFIDYEMDIRLIVLGNEVMGSMRRIPLEGDFRGNFSLGAEVEKFEAPQDMQELAVRAAKACNLEYGGIDILVDKTGKYYVLEANRTPGLTGISKALGINMAEKLVGYILS